MKNDERDENSLVEIIDEKLKNLRTNEIDGRERVKLREEKGGRAGKTKATWKGEPTNILKRQHWLKSLRKESKGFARVEWILDYGLQFQEEKGWAGGKRRQLRAEKQLLEIEMRIELNDEEARVDLTRNAPDQKG